MKKIVRHEPGIIDAEFAEIRHTPLLARVVSRCRVSPERTAHVSSHQQRDEHREYSIQPKGAMDVVMFTAKLILLILVGLIALGTTVDRPDKADAPQAPCKQ